jgi:hypothetical protein
MSATIFYSENGELSLPEEPRREGTKYKPVVLGEPLCVEICRVALGNTKDWMGDNEILASSWAKTGGDAKPAPRVMNFYREKLQPYEAISNLGAEQFGHNLIFYSPAYSGETLRMTLEILEIDQAGDEVIKFVKAVTNSLSGLPFFANQLPVLGALSMVPKVAELGIGLYNMINKNDTLLKADLDLAFERPFQNPLNPGRYVFVYGSVSPATFTKKYRLDNANKLVENGGQDASRKGGLEAPYAVIQITTDARKEYVKFQGVSQQQEFLGGIVSRLEDKYLQQIAGLLNPIAELASQGYLLSNIIRLKKDLDEVTDGDRRAKLTKMLNGELSKFGDGDTQEVLKKSLKSSGTPASAASASRPKALKKGEQVRAAVERMSGPFSVSDLQAACPNVSLSHIRRTLNDMKSQRLIRCQGRGRNATWIRTG